MGGPRLTQHGNPSPGLTGPTSSSSSSLKKANSSFHRTSVCSCDPCPSGSFGLSGGLGQWSLSLPPFRCEAWSGATLLGSSQHTPAPSTVSSQTLQPCHLLPALR